MEAIHTLAAHTEEDIAAVLAMVEVTVDARVAAILEGAAVEACAQEEYRRNSGPVGKDLGLETDDRYNTTENMHQTTR